MRHRFAVYFLMTGVLVLSGCADAGKPVPSAAADEAVIMKLARASEDSGNPASAESLYLQGIKKYPRSSSARVALAEFYIRQHAFTSAENAYVQAIAQDPENDDLQRGLANAYIDDNKPDKALSVLNPQIEKHPDNALFYNSRGVALDMQRHYSLAQSSYLSALQKDPAGAMNYKANLSMSYIIAGDYDQAITLLTPLLTSRDATPVIRQNLALAYGLKGDTVNAKRLSLQDLSASDTSDNIQFYRMLSRRNASAVRAAPVKPVSIDDVFPESLSPGSPPDATIKSDAVIPAETPVHFVLPLPVLKPDNH